MNNASGLFAEYASMPLAGVLFSFLASLALSVLIYSSYVICGGKDKKSAEFRKQVVILVPVTALIAYAVGKGIGAVLAFFGILLFFSIKHSYSIKDSAYILWSAAVGICCGTGQFISAVLGSAVIFVFTAALEIAFKGCFMLVINANPKSMRLIEDTVKNMYFDRLELKSKRSDNNGVEYVFEFPLTEMNNNKGGRLKKLLGGADGVSSIKLIRQD